MTTSNILVNVYGLENSNAFESKIVNLINTELTVYRKLSPVSEIYLSAAGMERAGGYGQYKKFITIKINGDEYNLKVHSTDSLSFDYYSDSETNRTYSNWIKRLVLDVLEANIEDIAEKIEQLNEN